MHASHDSHVGPSEFNERGRSLNRDSHRSREITRHLRSKEQSGEGLPNGSAPVADGGYTEDAALWRRDIESAQPREGAPPSQFQSMTEEAEFWRQEACVLQEQSSRMYDLNSRLMKQLQHVTNRADTSAAIIKQLEEERARLLEDASKQRGRVMELQDEVSALKVHLPNLSSALSSKAATLHRTMQNANTMQLRRESSGVQDPDLVEAPSTIQSVLPPYTPSPSASSSNLAFALPRQRPVFADASVQTQEGGLAPPRAPSLSSLSPTLHSAPPRSPLPPHQGGFSSPAPTYHMPYNTPASPAALSWGSEGEQVVRLSGEVRALQEEVAVVRAQLQRAQVESACWQQEANCLREHASVAARQNGKLLI